MKRGSPDENPFVGPRPIRKGEPLHGRSAEVRGLCDRLVANRLVVLHSPSGAGKSSLVYAGLIPALERQGFDVWTPIRVNLDPQGLADLPADCNRYLLSAMVSLEQELPEDRRRTPAQLAGLDFADYLETRPRLRRNRDKPVVLIFDQFEEVLTVAPRAIAAKRAFFASVGAALDAKRRRARHTHDSNAEAPHPGYWSLFVIREDYLAAFAPYRDYLPTQMSHGFRLDFLSREAAREAALPLAARRSEAEVDALIDELAKVKVQRSDGSFAEEAGLYVEPVHLQVVCRRLWQDLDMKLEAGAGVSEALGDYYAGEIAAITDGDVAMERRIREWFAGKLIVDGIRSQVRQEAEDSAGLDNALIKRLGDCYLVRMEQRAGSNWFELSHDRLVEAVTRNNHDWEQRHLSPLQALAKLWEAGGRDEGQLMNADALPAAERWARDNQALLTATEREFLAESQARRDRMLAARRRLIALALTAVAATIAMGVGLRWALAQRDKAHQAQAQAHQAQAEAEQAQAEAEQASEAAARARDLARSALLLAGAHEMLDSGDSGRAALLLGLIPQDQIAALHDWYAMVGDLRNREIPWSTRPHPDAVNTVQWSPDGSWVLTTCNDGNARLWQADGRGDPRLLGGHEIAVVQARFSHDGRRAVIASADGSARVWSIPDGELLARLEGHSAGLKDVAWSRDDRWIATASSDHSAQIWAADGSGEPRVLTGHDAEIRQIDFSPDSNYLASASLDGTIAIWGVETGSLLTRASDHRRKVFTVQWSPDGTRLVSGGEDDRALLWRFDGAALQLETALVGHEGPVVWAQWSPDGQRVATGSGDATARLWATDGSGAVRVLRGHGGRVNVAAWSPDGTRIATASEDMSARLWSAGDTLEPTLIMRQQNRVNFVAWSPDGQLIATVSGDRSAKIWHTDDTGKPLTLLGHHGRINTVDWHPDGQRILTGSGGGADDNSLRVWTVAGPERSATPQLLARYEQWVMGAAWSPDGTQVAVAVGDHSVRIHDAGAGEGEAEALTLTGHEDVVRFVAWSPDGARVASGSQDRSARVWRADGSGEPLVLRGHASQINTVDWNPDGQRLLTASRDRTARIWTLTDDVEIAEPVILRGHQAEVYAAMWSPDGQHVATASADGSAQIWSVAEARSVARFDQHEGEVLFVAWSPDGSQVLSTSADRSARIWRPTALDQPALVLEGHDNRVMAGTWSPDGQRVATVSQDLTGRVWRVDPVDTAAVVTWLRSLSRDCLDPKLRQVYFAESVDEANAAFLTCERRWGRTRGL